MIQDDSCTRLLSFDAPTSSFNLPRAMKPIAAIFHDAMLLLMIMPARRIHAARRQMREMAHAACRRLPCLSVAAVTLIDTDFYESTSVTRRAAASIRAKSCSAL